MGEAQKTAAALEGEEAVFSLTKQQNSHRMMLGSEGHPFHACMKMHDFGTRKHQ